MYCAIESLSKVMKTSRHSFSVQGCDPAGKPDLRPGAGSAVGHQPARSLPADGRAVRPGHLWRGRRGHSTAWLWPPALRAGAVAELAAAAGVYSGRRGGVITGNRNMYPLLSCQMFFSFHRGSVIYRGPVMWSWCSLWITSGWVCPFVCVCVCLRFIPNDMPPCNVSPLWFSFLNRQYKFKKENETAVREEMVEMANLLDGVRVDLKKKTKKLTF